MADLITDGGGHSFTMLTVAGHCRWCGVYYKEVFGRCAGDPLEARAQAAEATIAAVRRSTLAVLHKGMEDVRPYLDSLCPLGAEGKDHLRAALFALRDAVIAALAPAASANAARGEEKP